jgi:tetratricopeptide (TPR) repeat protein
MHDGMLIELIDGELDQAVDWYSGLISALPESDPSLPQLEYWKARALYAGGDVEAASTALRQVLTLQPQAHRAAIFLARLQATEKRIKSLPIHHSFREDTENWVHGWRNPGKGSLSLAHPDGGGDRTLAWTTRVEEGEDDAIGIFFDKAAASPRLIRLSIRSDNLSALVLPTIEDNQGNRYTLDRPISLHRKDWVAMDLRMQDFRPVDSKSAPWRPRSVRSFQIRDVTAFFSSERGPNTLFLGDVVIE